MSKDNCYFVSNISSQRREGKEEKLMERKRRILADPNLPERPPTSEDEKQALIEMTKSGSVHKVKKALAGFERLSKKEEKT